MPVVTGSKPHLANVYFVQQYPPSFRVVQESLFGSDRMPGGVSHLTGV
jgi:hypothetical protein